MDRQRNSGNYSRSSRPYSGRGTNRRERIPSRRRDSYSGRTGLEKLFEWIRALIEAALVVFILFFLMWPVKVEGISMEPTLKEGDRMAVSRIMAFFNWIDNGDIVICKVEVDEEIIEVVKRIIGKPGDIVTISNGKVSINGSLLEEDYLGDVLTYPDTFIALNNDQYFVMGDNRMFSNDSRNLGPVKKDDIIAKVIWQFYPLNKIRIFP